MSVLDDCSKEHKKMYQVINDIIKECGRAVIHENYPARIANIANMAVKLKNEIEK